MKRIALLAGAAVVIGAAPASPPPVAQYWMDAATASGMGAAFMGGGRPNPAQIMQMMNGGGGLVAHTLNLYLASRNKAAAPQANHFIPPGMQMGPSLPLVAPAVAQPVRDTTPGLPDHFQRPRGRMLIYWGCGEHAGAGQPTVIDFSKMTAGKIPPGFASMMGAVRAAQPPRPGQSAGYGEWPNDRDSRPVPANASLIGAHRVEGNYSPPIAFSVGQGQDFMPALSLRQSGASPSGAVPLSWNRSAQATGYALSMFGSSGGEDMVIWTSANKPTTFPMMDYLSPAQVKPLVASGAVLAPSTAQCTVPAEVVRAAPEGMVMMIGYGPEGFYSDKPKAPTWTVRTRYKTTATLMMGMAGMDQDSDDEQSSRQEPPPPQQPKKRKGFGLGDLLSVVPH